LSTGAKSGHLATNMVCRSSTVGSSCGALRGSPLRGSLWFASLRNASKSRLVEIATKSAQPIHSWCQFSGRDFLIVGGQTWSRPSKTLSAPVAVLYEITQIRLAIGTQTSLEGMEPLCFPGGMPR
jgi:hypothetical protein